MSKNIETVDRKEFIKRFMQDCGLPYDVASVVYKCMTKTIEDGIINNKKIAFGKIGAIKPVWMPPRVQSMNFNKRRKVYNLDGRYKFKFMIYKKWLNDHDLNWYE